MSLAVHADDEREKISVFNISEYAWTGPEPTAFYDVLVAVTLRFASTYTNIRIYRTLSAFHDLIEVKTNFRPKFVYTPNLNIHELSV